MVTVELKLVVLVVVVMLVGVVVVSAVGEMCFVLLHPVKQFLAPQ